MDSYKLANSAGTMVTLTTTGGQVLRGITAGGRLWPRYQAWLAEGNVPEPYQDDEELFWAQNEFDIHAARSAFAAAISEPVTVTTAEGTYIYNGGKESAMDINGAVELAEALGETEVYIWDVDNIARPMSFSSAKVVAATIAAAWRTAAYTKQAALVEIAARIYQP